MRILNYFFSTKIDGSLQTGTTVPRVNASPVGVSGAGVSTITSILEQKSENIFCRTKKNVLSFCQKTYQKVYKLICSCLNFIFSFFKSGSVVKDESHADLEAIENNSLPADVARKKLTLLNEDKLRRMYSRVGENFYWFRRSTDTYIIKGAEMVAKYDDVAISLYQTYLKKQLIK